MVKLIIPFKNQYRASQKWLNPNGAKKLAFQNSKKPLVSVITIVRNSRETIEKTILSVANQSYKNFEYIVVDGDSTDGTTDILKKHNKLISKWVSEKDSGSIDASNKGVSLAKGEIIFILCADDFIKKNTLESIVKGFNLNKNCSFVYGDMAMVSKKKISSYSGNYSFKKNIIVGNPTFNYPSIAWKKDVFEKIGLYTPSFPWNNDYEFLVRLYFNKLEGVYVPNYSVYRKPGGQGEGHIFKSFIDILTINYIYKLPIFKSFINLFPDLCKMILKQTFSRFKKYF
jgi:glycosyltransferase involved in cell wall biosynthesis